ncbi:DDT domain-containing protein DDB_G0282237 isoform X2 [Punica granatum]|nr:DDT domain-containing protein DDB_G0282237 isoform X2 [Punica granatum]
MLPLKDLADTIAMKLQDCLYEGVELYGKKEDGVFPCRIVKVRNQGASSIQYEICWLGRDKTPTGNALVNEEELIKKKLPFSRSMLKSFIRETTYRSAPWVLHDRLAEKHGISNNLPEELRSKFYFHNGVLVNFRKRVKNAEEQNGNTVGQELCRVYKRKKKVAGEKLEDLGNEGKNDKDGDQTTVEVIKYPIEDLLVKPGADDPAFTTRPSPSRDFKVPLDCVGDLLMVWDFCSSFSRLLHLSPFSLEDFENAICHKDSNLVLIVETHSTLLRLLIKDDGEYSAYIQGKRRKSKITLITWTEYLCDFLDMTNAADLHSHIATIKRGHYGLIEPHAKLEILRLLVNHALETDLVRELLDEYIDQWHELGATRRGEALQEAKKRREEKEHLKAQSDSNAAIDENSLNDVDKGGLDNNNGKQSGEIALKKHNHVSKKSVSDRANGAFKNNARLQNGDAAVRDGSMQHSHRKGSRQMVLKQGTDERKVPTSSKEQRKQHYEREMEKRFIRTNPLGRDRHHNRYWWFRRDGRILVESSDHKLWGYYNTKEELDLLIRSLNCKGEREKALHRQLEKYYTRICTELQKRSKELADKIAMEEAVVRRSTRVRAPPRDNPANAFLRYVNKWKEE